MLPKDIWIKGDNSTVRPETKHLGFAGIYAPPVAAGHLAVKVQLDGQDVAVQQARWLPSEFQIKGLTSQATVLATLTPLIGRGGAVMSVCCISPQTGLVPVTVSLTGDVEWVESAGWGFAVNTHRSVSTIQAGQGPGELVVNGPKASARLCTTLVQAQASTAAIHGLAPVGPKVRPWYIVLTLGAGDQPPAAPDPAGAVERAREYWLKKLKEIHSRLPRLETDDPDLCAWYDRSLLTLLTCRCEGPGYLVSPWYATGSLDGGAVCSYLWDFGFSAAGLALADPEGFRAMFLAMLSLDLGKCYALTPFDGSPAGPWYAYNSYSAVRALDAYITWTGNASILKQPIPNRSQTLAGPVDVFTAVKNIAFLKDDLSQPPELIDYGGNSNLLELDRTQNYTHMVPSPNGERYWMYRTMARLGALAGHPMPELQLRAEPFRKLFLKRFWQPGVRWFASLDPKGQPRLAYSIQVFNLLRTGILGSTQVEGLLSHLNEREFLSQCGPHSLSKLDPGYDETDIDFGGPGTYIGSAPELVNDLYSVGRDREAAEVLGRIRWWGMQFPYYPQAVLAAKRDYRHDGLANEISGIVAAQCIIGGVFGILPTEAGVRVAPHALPFARKLNLRAVRVRGLVFDVEVRADSFTVIRDGQRQRKPLGGALVLPYPRH
jgi:hypothetical protein